MKTPKVENENPPVYHTPSERDDAVIQRALEILKARFSDGRQLNSPQSVKDYLQLKLGGLEHEVFSVVFLTSQHHVIAVEEMFRGTLNQTSVYPREVVKRALQLNAGAVILAHNHPSGITEPSRADEFLTQCLKSALKLIDVLVLDHVIVGSASTVSFAERGLL